MSTKKYVSGYDTTDWGLINYWKKLTYKKRRYLLQAFNEIIEDYEQENEDAKSVDTDPEEYTKVPEEEESEMEDETDTEPFEQVPRKKMATDLTKPKKTIKKSKK